MYRAPPLASDLSKGSGIPDRKRRDQKPRVLFSCTLCRERKLKCNRAHPCLNCHKRGLGESCSYVAERALRTALEHRLAVQDRLNHGHQKPASNNSAERRLLSPASNGSEFINLSHWQTMMKDVTRQLSENRTSVDRRPIDESFQVDRSPILLSGLSQNVEIGDLVASLPSRSAADRLVDVCFESQQPSMIMIHVPSFKSQYSKFWQNHTDVTYAWLSILYGVLACGVYIEHIMHPNIQSSGLPETFYLYRKQSAISLSKAGLTSPGCFKVEAAVLYMGIEYLKTNDTKVGISILVGLASRLAMLMGYHRSAHLFHPPLTAFEAEMRRRTWLMLSVSDAVMAYQTGLPRAIYPGVGDTTRPRNLLDQDINPEITILPESRQGSDSAHNIPFMIAMDDLLSIAAEITDACSRGAVPLDRIVSLGQKLLAVKGSIPEALLVPSQSPGSRDYNGVMQNDLEMVYQRSRCMLYRQYLSTNPVHCNYDAFKWACVDAARCVLEQQCVLFQEVLCKPQNRRLVWFGSSISISNCLTAAMVVCLEVIDQSKTNQAFPGLTRNDLISLIRRTCVGLQNTPRWSTEVEKAARVLETVLERVEHLIIGEQSEGSQAFTPEIREPVSDMMLLNPMVYEQRPAHLMDQDFLNWENPVEMFDWTQWDWELQHLNIPVIGDGSLIAQNLR